MDNLRMIQECHRLKQYVRKDIDEVERALGGSSAENYKRLREQQLTKVEEILTLISSL